MRLLILLISILPLNAFAEVSDKIASIPLMWVQAVIFGGIGFYLASRKWWLSIVGFILFFAMAIGTYDMQSDKFMKVAVIKEQGEIYFAIGYITSIIVAVLTTFGILYGYWRKPTKCT
ncbi:hypothetical protein ORI98_02555 [Shewanella sp. ULN5]|uniref:hypothetical protein n=1 Tax=Shewanella sp. ULN5 TaxID=2994678 RepID=UPI00273DFE42|nr:hypothetical protein [Shewanella sp. ULN5]MDP5145321.1 hypothetical protein [Shewanella sp. ULN5]